MTADIPQDIDPLRYFAGAERPRKAESAKSTPTPSPTTSISLWASKEGEFLVGPTIVKLGKVHGVPFYMAKFQFQNWEHTHLTLDAIPGHGGMFSLEQATGKHFIIRPRLFTDEKLQQLGPVESCD